MMASCYCRRYYWFEVLDECNNLMLDTDGVGNALASILEDSKLQVWGCSIHSLLFCFCNTQRCLCRATKTLLSTLLVHLPSHKF
jgi:hypothetical protein